MRYLDGQVRTLTPQLSIARQCRLAGLSRSTYYHAPIFESEQNLLLLRRLDELYIEYPFYGSRRMLAVLRRDFAYRINRKRIQRLMGVLELAAMYPKPKLSQPTPGHHVYPYLLRSVPIERVNQVWSSDITYIRMQEGFAYLAAVITGAVGSCSVGRHPTLPTPGSVARLWISRYPAQ